jgi:hypothetical protein
MAGRLEPDLQHGAGLPTVNALSRPQQWDSVPLPSSQDLTQVQVMAFTDSHDDMVQYVYEINISSGAASIGVDTGAFQDDDYCTSASTWTSPRT